ncbi:MAG: prepilin peptidase [Actinobacteria bacterium]|nr:prepilin peptidase [Actinomycetota bacterium]
MTVALIVIAAWMGLLVGSFLTVVTERVPNGESIVAPGSRCGSCGLRLGPLDLVPVFSWLVLGGKCRRCRTNIGIDPLVLELGTCALFVAMAVKFDAPWETAAFCVLAAGLFALSWIDLRTKRLPREITYVTLALGVPLLVIAALVRDEPHKIWTMVAGAAIALAFMGGLYVVSRGGLGDGDVRLSPLLGAYLGWLGLAYVPAGLFLGFLFGAVVGVAAIVAGRAGRRTAIPFGPFLAAGTIAAVFVGRSMIDAFWTS